LIKSRLIGIANEDLAGETIQQAKILEVRCEIQVYACGVIITPDITNYVPPTNAKDSDLYVTQFDNSVAESAGLLRWTSWV
jgi:DNA polymerase-3 subunit alpha